MKKQTLLLLVLFSFIPIRAQDAMKVNQTTDSPEFLMSELHKLTFEGDNFYIHLKDGTTFPYSFQALSILTFGEAISPDFIQHKLSAQSIGLFPNPVSQFLNIRLATDQEINVKIIDLKGIILYQKEGHLNDGRIDVAQLRSGIYLLNITMQGSSTTKMFIKN